jgi:hypothetical protein
MQGDVFDLRFHFVFIFHSEYPSEHKLSGRHDSGHGEILLKFGRMRFPRPRSHGCSVASPQCSESRTETSHLSVARVPGVVSSLLVVLLNMQSSSISHWTNSEDRLSRSRWLFSGDQSAHGATCSAETACEPSPQSNHDLRACWSSLQYTWVHYPWRARSTPLARVLMLDSHWNAVVTIFVMHYRRHTGTLRRLVRSGAQGMLYMKQNCRTHVCDHALISPDPRFRAASHVVRFARFFQ